MCNIPDYEKTLLPVTEMGNKVNIGHSDDKTEDLVSRLDQLELSQYKCEICDAKYKVPWTLKAHMVKKHQAKYACKICNEVFDHKMAHDIHTAIHTFPCDICQAVLADEWSLIRHKKVHSQLLVCKHCSEVFLEKSALEDHVVTHLSCDICGKEWDSVKKLNRHILSHK